jgi:hypothetical protein
VRSALAKVEGVEENDIQIDNTEKTATVVLDAAPTPAFVQSLVDAFKGTKFTAEVKS